MRDYRAKVEPFGFDRIFQAGSDNQPGGIAALTARVQALHDQLLRADEQQVADLAQARRDGFQAGLVEGRNEGAAALLSATDAIHAALEDLDRRFADTVADQARIAAEAVLAAAEALAGHAVADAPLQAIEEALARVLSQVARGTRLCIRINPAQHEDLLAVLEARQRLDRRRLHLTALPDPDVTPGDAVIFWDEGGLAVDAGARRAAVVAELLPLLGATPGGGDRTH